jgi:hypothetical protein
MATNTFVSAARDAASLVYGAKGELMHSTTGKIGLDAFTHLVRDTDESRIHRYVDSMIKSAHDNLDTISIIDVFRLMFHKRGVSRSKTDGGEGERKLFYIYFIRLYDHYPNTCIEIVRENLIPHYGYWKDYRYIWKMICANDMAHRQRFNKYNPLIEAFRDSILKQRKEDLGNLAKFVKPQILSRMPIDMFKRFIETQESVGNTLNINMCGKFCVREKGADNKLAYWYVEDSTNDLIIQPHTTYMVRAVMKVKNPVTGQLSPIPNTQQIPYGVLKQWRQSNAKLNTVIDVVENKMAAGEFHKIKPSAVTSKNNSIYLKAFLNEKRKGSVDACDEETGNRHPNDLIRVQCRKNFRNNINDPKKVNASQLFPHEITYPIQNASSTTQIDYYNALWESLVGNYQEKLKASREKFAAEIAENGGSNDAVQKALLGGNFIGCLDISGSMYWVGKPGKRPIDVGTGLATFMSRVSAPIFRDMVITFSAEPHIRYLKGNLRGRINDVMSDGGYNTDYYKMHCAVADMCINKRVKPEDIPIIVVFTDGNFDSFDDNAKSGRWNTTHEKIQAMWASKGIGRIPTIVVWNLNPNLAGQHAQSNTPGIMQLQGQSPSLFKYILYGETLGDIEETIMVNGVEQKVTVSSVDPYTIYRKAMDNHEYFEPLLKVLNCSTEGHLVHVKAYMA